MSFAAAREKSPRAGSAPPTGIVVSNSADYVEAAFDVLRGGGVVVPLRQRADEARIAAAGVVDVIEPAVRTGWFRPSAVTCSDPDAWAQISFTSGTEGEPKGIVLQHRALEDVVARLLAVSGVDAEAREYVGVPVYHSFGYGRCRLLGRVGAQAYLPPAGFDGSEFRRMLAAGEVNSLSAVPSLLRLLLADAASFGQERVHLRFIEIGSQPMTGRGEARIARTLSAGVHRAALRTHRGVPLNLVARRPGRGARA